MHYMILVWETGVYMCFVHVRVSVIGLCTIFYITLSNSLRPFVCTNIPEVSGRPRMLLERPEQADKETE